MLPTWAPIQVVIIFTEQEPRRIWRVQEDFSVVNRRETTMRESVVYIGQSLFIIIIINFFTLAFKKFVGEKKEFGECYGENELTHSNVIKH